MNVAFPMMAAAGVLLAQLSSDEIAPKLRESAEKVLLAKLDATKISCVDELVFRRLPDFDYLGVEADFEVSWWWESTFRHGFLLRKKGSDPNWSKAELFDVEMPVSVVLARLAAEIEAALSPWKTPDLTNQ